MNRVVISLCLAALLGLLIFGCEEKPAATEADKDVSMVSGEAPAAAAPALLCAKCGQIKGSSVCCQPDAEKCSG